MKRTFALFGWLVLPTLILAQDHTSRDTHEMHRLHQDPQAYMAMLDDPQRDAYQKPHHIDDRDPYLALLKKMIKPGGQIVMVDFKKAETPVGPPMEMRIDRDDLV